MSDLKPCPFCGGEALLRERYIQGIANRKHYRRECRHCKATFADWYRSMKKADEAWNRRAQPANEPLTIEQLKQMDGEPVWVKHFAQTKFASAWIEVGEYGLVDAKLQRIVFMKNAPVMFEKYKGDFAIAYDHKQGGEQE